MKLSKVVDVIQEKCLNCHLCIAVCPVKFCNDGSGDYVNLNSELCIGCGECIDACPHKARVIVDDFEAAMASLKRGEKIAAIVAPAIAAAFPDTYLNFNGWLRSIGIKAIFDVSFGAELTVESYIKHIQQNKPKTVIAQPCPAIVNFVELYHPELLEYLAPADSPMMHTIKMIKNYYPEFSGMKILIVSPCVAKKREFEEVGLGDFNVTIAKFREYLESNQIRITSYPKTDYNNPPAERAVLFSTPGGLLRTAMRDVPGIEQVSRKIEGPKTVYHYLSHLRKDIDAGIAPKLVDCLNCELGCNGGTGTTKNRTQDQIESAVEKRNREMQENYLGKGLLRLPFVAKWKIQKVIKKFWKPNIYNRRYQNLSTSQEMCSLKKPSTAQVQAIFQTMLKTTKEDELNCRACGYNNCEEMAMAIHNNLNKKENCHVYTNKYLKNSVDNLLVEMDKLAAGDLNAAVSSEKDDAVGLLYQGFNKVVLSLRSLIGTIYTLIHETSRSGYNIAALANQMAAGTQQQSSQTDEVVSAIEEMTRTILETSQNTAQASIAAKNAGQKAVLGGGIMQHTIDSMMQLASVVQATAGNIETLGNSSDQIGEIIQVIEDIADQTNLLALNAAIEAARAGEQGRGFAVVADEVRKLAERTSKATKEIEQMIKHIQHDTADAVNSMRSSTAEVENGRHLALQADSSLKEIITETDRVSDVITQVAAASEEESSAAEQISKNMECINSVTRQTAEGSEQIAQLVDGLLNMTNSLKDAISHFELDKNTRNSEIHLKNSAPAISEKKKLTFSKN